MSATTEHRERLNARRPLGYRWERHVALIASFVAAGLALGLSRLGEVAPLEWLGLGAVMVAILFGEWASHRFAMHRRVFPRAVYHRHVVEHHAFFSRDRMEIGDLDDLYWVFRPGPCPSWWRAYRPSSRRST